MKLTFLSWKIIQMCISLTMKRDERIGSQREEIKAKRRNSGRKKGSAKSEVRGESAKKASSVLKEKKEAARSYFPRPKDWFPNDR